MKDRYFVTGRKNGAELRYSTSHLAGAACAVNMFTDVLIYDTLCARVVFDSERPESGTLRFMKVS